MSSKCCGEISPHKSASDHECAPPISGLGVITLDENRAYISKAAEGNRDSQTTGTREGIPIFGVAIRRQVVYRCAIRYPIGIRLSSVRGPTVATQLRMGGISKMFWRALLLCISLFVVCLVVDLSSHKDFASATIHSSVDSNYFIKCDGIEFGKNDTHVSVRLTDKNRLPQFQTFRGTYPTVFQAGDRKLSLETDLPYLKPDQVLLAESSTEPAVLFRPKPNNQVHEAIINLWFQQ